MTNNTIILAFSGGLDTSFCVPWLRETYDAEVITATVNTGGLDDAASEALKKRALQLGAVDHVLIEGRPAFFDQVIRFLIMGNVRRGNLYPLCVGAERGLQAALLAKLAQERGVQTVAHGCTAAGNDQVRFEIALRTLAPELTVLAPVRDHAFQREAQLTFLAERSLPAPASGSSYSINRGLWGVTIGGTETLDSKASIPEEAWQLSSGALDRAQDPRELTVGFQQGVPVSLDGQPLNPVDLIERLETIGSQFAIGRGIHLGDTILGTKGRVAFEAPAAALLIDAHRELEKLTLSPLQLRMKESLSQSYGDFVHEGKHLESVCRDIEAFLLSSQEMVSGEVHLTLRPGNVFVTGVESPHSLLHASRGSYGEAAGEWTSEDAVGFSRILSIQGLLQSRVRSA